MSGNEKERPESALRYQWYSGYNREGEYDKDPSWTSRTKIETIEGDEDNMFVDDTAIIYDKFQSESHWVESDNICKLTDYI